MTGTATAATVAAAGVTIPPSAPVAPPIAGQTYTYDVQFQGKVAAMCLRDTNFMQRVDSLVLPEYFENIADAVLVNIANRYFKKYRKSPGDLITLSALIKQDIINKIIKKEYGPTVVERVKALWQVDISDRDFVVEEVAKFARNKAMSKAILESVDLLDTNDFERIDVAFKAAMNVGANEDGGAYDYASMIDVRTEERLLRAAGKLPPTGITTGHPEIDKVLYHKGWGRGELSVIMGAAKAGKTTALLDFAISACGHANRYNVLYITLEVAPRIISERVDARISQYMISELGINVHDVKDRVRKFMDNAGKFIVQEFPTGSMKVSDLRRLIERYKSKGIVFDLVVVDYADLMQPERYSSESIENSKSVYIALRGLAMEENFAVLSATQTNRDGAKKAVAQMTDVSDDFNKVRIADILISINKTDEEKSMNQARLFFAACRNQRAGFSIRISQDLSRMSFIKEVIGEE